MSTTREAPGASGWTVRRVAEDERADFLAVDAHAFGMTAPDELVEAERDTHEDDRDIGAYDGATLAGIATAYSFDIGVPGASLPAAGVTWVGVLPTHRRRGVLRALMTHQLHEVHEAGHEPLAVLWASEPQIYGRFGYGLASRALSLDVPRDPRALRPDVPSDPHLRLRLVDPTDWKSLTGVYETVSRRRPGLPARDERWWRRTVRDFPTLRDGKSALRCVVAESGGDVRGYALYATRQQFDESFGSGQVSVREVMAVDGPALATLYGYLFDLDLMARTHLWNVPADDPLQHWLQNPRRAKPSLGDGLYVRLVDLDRSLAGRRYATPLDVVLDVADDLCPWNAGRWRVAGGPDGASCERTDADPDLSLGVADVGSAYLGGVTMAELALAGRVAEHRPGALATASAAFAHSPAPWCPAVF
jgi:predicted acetyltransferase